MASTFVIDKFYLTLSFIITLGFQLLGFTIAFILQFDKITDLWGGINFFALSLITLLLSGSNMTTRSIVLSVFYMIWAARLGGFLLFRVLKMGSDSRFDEMRSQIVKFAGFWTFQIIWVFTVSLPVVIVNSPAFSRYHRRQPAFGTSRDIAGVVMFVIGFLVEAVADAQKLIGKSKGARGIFKGGLWKWSRHPPYFGEIFLHWGLWTLAVSAAQSSRIPISNKQALWASCLGPILTMGLLLFLSGIPLAEKSQGKKQYLLSYGKNKGNGGDGGATWRAYKEYLNETSILIPIPPFLYRPLSTFIKQTILMDFLWAYGFDEEKDGGKALAEEAEQTESQ